MSNSRMTYPRPLRLLHWAIAMLVVAQLLLAVVLTQLRSLEYGQRMLEFHRQCGILVLLLVCARLVAGARHKSPPAEQALPEWQRRIAHWLHNGVLVLLVLQPVLGAGVAWARGDAVSLLGVVRFESPWDIGDGVRDWLMRGHVAIAITLFAFVAVHVGAVVFNRVARGVSVVDRMLAPIAPDVLVDRVPLATQLMIAFGALMTVSTLVGINAVHQVRSVAALGAELDAHEVAAAESLRTAQLAWKPMASASIAGASPGALAGAVAAAAPPAQAALDEAAGLLQDADQRASATQLSQRISAAARGSDAAQLQAIDASLQELVDQLGGLLQQRRSELQERAAAGHDLIVVTIAPLLLAGFAVSLLLAHSLLGALGRIGELVAGVTAQAGGLAARVRVEGRGDFGRLMRGVLAMGDTVAARAQQEQEERGRMALEQRATEQRLQQEADQRVAAQRELESAERARQRAQLADQFEMQVAAIVEGVTHTSVELRDAAEQLAESTETANARSRAAAEMASELSEHARRVAESGTRLAGLAASVRASADNSHRHARSAHGNAADARSDVENLVKATQEIGTITDVINAVARQTNILAINARIEAARAGEAGSGFAIVADEVKKLASATHGATSDIDRQVQGVAHVGASSAAALERLRANIGELDEMASAIFGLTEKQSEATADIEGLIREASQVSDRVTQEVRTAESAAAAAQGLASNVRGAAESLGAQATDLQLQVGEFLAGLRQAGGSTQAPPRHAAQGEHAEGGGGAAPAAQVA